MNNLKMQKLLNKSALLKQADGPQFWELREKAQQQGGKIPTTYNPSPTQSGTSISDAEALKAFASGTWNGAVSLGHGAAQGGMDTAHLLNDLARIPAYANSHLGAQGTYMLGSALHLLGKPEYGNALYRLSDKFAKDLKQGQGFHDYIEGKLNDYDNQIDSYYNSGYSDKNQPTLMINRLTGRYLLPIIATYGVAGKANTAKSSLSPIYRLWSPLKAGGKLQALPGNATRLLFGKNAFPRIQRFLARPSVSIARRFIGSAGANFGAIDKALGLTDQSNVQSETGKKLLRYTRTGVPIIGSILNPAAAGNAVYRHLLGLLPISGRGASKAIFRLGQGLGISRNGRVVQPEVSHFVESLPENMQSIKSWYNDPGNEYKFLFAEGDSALKALLWARQHPEEIEATRNMLQTDPGRLSQTPVAKSLRQIVPSTRLTRSLGIYPTADSVGYSVLGAGNPNVYRYDQSQYLRPFYDVYSNDRMRQSVFGNKLNTAFETANTTNNKLKEIIDQWLKSHGIDVQVNLPH